MYIDCVLQSALSFLGIKLYILNEVEYGRMLTPAIASMSLKDDQIAFSDAKIDWMGKYLGVGFPFSIGVGVRECQTLQL